MEWLKDSIQPMETSSASIGLSATASSHPFNACSKQLINNKVVIGTNSGELAVMSSDLTERNILNLKMKKSIRNFAAGIDHSKIFVVSDDLRIYLIDLEKNAVAADGFYEGHLDLVTGIDAIPDSLNFLTWFDN